MLILSRLESNLVRDIGKQPTESGTNQVESKEGSNGAKAEENEEDCEDEGFHGYIIVRFCLLFGEVTNFR